MRSADAIGLMREAALGDSVRDAQLMQEAAHARDAVLRGQLAAVIISATRQIFVPDLRYTEVVTAKRVLVRTWAAALVEKAQLTPGA